MVKENASVDYGIRANGVLEEPLAMRTLRIESGCGFCDFIAKLFQSAQREAHDAVHILANVVGER